ncbi:MAG TPA: hypothetical protein PLU91_19530, partial [Verrucomicrobiota bacterium]|nr:hypothetical protein [Verrucomicrobiota bacterium]
RRIWPNLRANSANPSAAPWAFAGARTATRPQASPPLFQAAMGEDHYKAALRLLLAKRPGLKPP